MRKKQVFILAYARKNLGDDLFISFLLEKYPNIQFYIHIQNEEDSKAFEEFDNLTIIRENAKELCKENAKEYDGYIYVGGSIFMEGGRNYKLCDQFLEFMKETKKQNIPFFYASSNFGPYTTKEYYELAKETFANCTDICFRDKYSYNLFQNVPTVRYAPDLIFSLAPKDLAKEEKTIGITVIDLEIRKDLREYEEVYIKTLSSNIIEYIQQGMKIYLFSFCKYEGDEKGISKILDNLPEEYSSKVVAVNYDGDIKKFIKKYKKMEYMICARFHAMVLSTIFEQKCKIMSYSPKIDRVIEDLNLFDPKNVIQLKELKDTIEIPLRDFEIVGHSQVLEIREQAKNQFKAIEDCYGK